MSALEQRPRVEEPRITVAIPTWQGARFLREAIESVLTQSFPAFELLVVDDGSTDESATIAASYDDSRVRCLRNEVRLGLCRNWNRCLSEARGHYVAIFHQDDRMEPGNLARKFELLERHSGASFVYSDVFQIDADGAIVADHWWRRTPDRHEPVWPGRDFFAAEFSGGNLVCAPSVVLRREAALAVGGFDTSLPFTTDWAMWLRLALRGDVGFVSERLVSYRQHPSMETAHFRGPAGLREELAAKRRFLQDIDATSEEGGSLRARAFVHIVEEAWRRAWQCRAAREDAEALSFFELAGRAHAEGIEVAGRPYARLLFRIAHALDPSRLKATQQRSVSLERELEQLRHKESLAFLELERLRADYASLYQELVQEKRMRAESDARAQSFEAEQTMILEALERERRLAATASVEATRSRAGEADLAAKLEVLSQQKDESMAECEELRARLAAVLGSRSWRLTAPMRRLLERARSVKST